MQRTQSLALALGASTLVLSAGCPTGWSTNGKDWGDSGPVAATYVGSYPTDTCAWTWNHFGAFAETVVSVCMHGTHSGIPPENMTLLAPCQAFGSPTNPTLLPATASSSDATTFFEQFSNGGSYICQAGTGGGDYTASFPMDATCESYFRTQVSYATLEPPYDLCHSDDTDCVCLNQISTAYMRSTYPKLDSSPASCAAGTATFQMMARATGGAASSATVWLTPVAQTAAQFPERAWLRQVEVLDWGAATSLRIARLGEHLILKPSGVVGGRAQAKSAVPLQLPAGDTPMSTMFAIDHVAASAPLPRVKLSWSCEQDPANLHYRSLGQGYVGTPLASLGSPQRIVLWPDWAEHHLDLALEGRFVDHVPAALAITGPQSATFTVRIPAYGATLSAAIRQVDNTIYVTSATVKMGDSVRLIPDSAFTPL